MARSSVNIKVRRRKVTNLASYSRRYTVSNCTIRNITDGKKLINPFTGNGEWKEEKHKQPKNLRKRVIVYEKIHIPNTRKVVDKKRIKVIPSEFPAIVSHKWKGIAEKMEAYTKHKLAKWERKNPKPCDEDDLFKAEFIPAWEAKRESALEAIRNKVTSMYDKLQLIGRFEQSTGEYKEEKIAEIKDRTGDGHKVNKLKLEKSKLLKKAQTITDKVHAKNTKLVCTNLKDHKRQKGRIILPRAAA